MPLLSKQLAQATLCQQIVQEIRDAIINRSLVPGETLVERQLADRLGTSLTPIREALVQLEAEGLITKKPNWTTHVTKLSDTEVQQIYTVRQVLERYAFEEAARLADQTTVKKLKDLHRDALAAARAGADTRYIVADLRWHEAVWQATLNACLVETLRRVVVPLFGFSAMTARHGFDLKRDAQTHAPLLEAIATGDPVGAGQAFERFSAVWHKQAFARESGK